MEAGSGFRVLTVHDSSSEKGRQAEVGSLWKELEKSWWKRVWRMWRMLRW